MINIKFWICGLLFLSINWGQAQGQEDVFPSLYAQEAMMAIQGAYTPGSVLSYGNARDTLFKRILGKNDSLTCVYSGHRVYMDPNEDPTTTVYQNGGTNGINTEHTWPQAYGAGDGNARSNMYHLFPTRIKVNEARANFPFAEIPDVETQSWFYLNQSQASIPSSNIERYSEYKQGVFEPREDFKGDIARAMFYFYSIYHQEAASAPAGFFTDQLPTLYQWHLADPVDASEWERNQGIAPYQDNKSNPYILDSTLVRRVFCEELNLLCTSVATQNPSGDTPVKFSVYPNPYEVGSLIELDLPEPGEISLCLYDVFGKKISTIYEGFQASGTANFPLSALDENLSANGMLFCVLTFRSDQQSFSLVRKIMILP